MHKSFHSQKIIIYMFFSAAEMQKAPIKNKRTSILGEKIMNIIFYVLLFVASTYVFVGGMKGDNSELAKTFRLTVAILVLVVAVINIAHTLMQIPAVYINLEPTIQVALLTLVTGGSIYGLYKLLKHIDEKAIEQERRAR